MFLLSSDPDARARADWLQVFDLEVRRGLCTCAVPRLCVSPGLKCAVPELVAPLDTDLLHATPSWA